MPRRAPPKSACGRTSVKAAQKANELLTAGDLLGALRCTQHAARLAPSDAGIAIGLADMLSMADRAGEAAASFEKVLTLLPTSPEVYFRYGHFYGVREQTAPAMRLFQVASALAPDFVENMHALAVIKSLEADYAGAEKALRRVLRLRPTHETAQFDLGLALQQQQRPRYAGRSGRGSFHGAPSSALECTCSCDGRCIHRSEYPLQPEQSDYRQL